MVSESICRSLLLAATAFTLLHGCAKQPAPAQPVSWYLAHTEERQAKVTWCADDLQRKDTPDCRNALEANRRKAMGTMKDAPPLDWNKPEPKPH
jgi:hypothetical protein